MRNTTSNNNHKIKLWKKFLFGATAALVVCIAVFLIWANQVLQPDAVLLENFYIENSGIVTVTEHLSYWEISPKNNTCTAESCEAVTRGIIYYPGAKIDARAYFDTLDFLVNGKPFSMKLFITKPPLHLAIFGAGQADDIIKNNPDTKEWIIGGHSLGGAMACKYAASHADKIKRLLLIGSYCASDLHAASIQVISIYGTQDGVLNVQKLQDNKKYLPDSATYFVIEGMSHAQAGDYGVQSGDKAATKSSTDIKTEIIDILKNEFKK
jgi:Alpha/beta hydrolase family